MSEQQAFIRAICSQPKDDVARLVYADWLDDHNEPHYAEFIRWQIATGFIAKRAAGEGAQVYSLENRQDAPRGFLRSIRALIDSLPARCGFEISRGFVNLVECTAELWLRFGDAIVAEQPIEKVRLTNLAGWECKSSCPISLPGGGYPDDRWPGIAFELPPAAEVREILPTGGVMDYRAALDDYMRAIVASLSVPAHLLRPPS